MIEFFRPSWVPDLVELLPITLSFSLKKSKSFTTPHRSLLWRQCREGTDKGTRKSWFLVLVTLVFHYGDRDVHPSRPSRDPRPRREVPSSRTFGTISPVLFFRWRCPSTTMVPDCGSPRTEGYPWIREVTLSWVHSRTSVPVPFLVMSIVDVFFPGTCLVWEG